MNCRSDRNGTNVDCGAFFAAVSRGEASAPPADAQSAIAVKAAAAGQCNKRISLSINASVDPEVREEHPKVGDNVSVLCRTNSQQVAGESLRLTTYQPVGMYNFMTASHRPTDAKTKLLDAAIEVVRAQGYAATSVDELCRKAGVTKGAFFHHFESKDALAVAAANYWSATTSALFESAPYHTPEDPLDRVLAYVDFRRSILRGTPAEFSCFAGTTVQETFATKEGIRAACEASIFGHAETLSADISEAMRRHKVKGEWTARSLALHTQAVLQGAFILAKAKGSATVALESIDHLRRYIELLFNRKPSRPARTA